MINLNVNVNDQVKLLNDCIINIFTNIVHNKKIICRDKDE